MLYDKFNLMQTIQCIIFQIDQVKDDGATSTEEFGIDILQINGIIRYEQPTEIPNVPSWIKGLINLRGQIIPVFDFRDFFGFKNDAITENTRIVNMEYGSMLIGMVVDRVMEVLDINLDSISEVPNFISTTIEKQFIQGIGRIDEKRLITILDIDNFFSDTELEDLDFISENKSRIKKILDSYKARAKDVSTDTGKAAKKTSVSIKRERTAREVNRDRERKDWEGKVLELTEDEGEGSFEIELEELEGASDDSEDSHAGRTLIEVERPAAARRQDVEARNAVLIEDAKHAFDARRWEDAAMLFEQSKDICIEQGWRDGVDFASRMLDQVNEAIEKDAIEASLQDTPVSSDAGAGEPVVATGDDAIPGDPVVDEAPPAPVCEWCGRRFKSDKGLASHQRSCKKKK